MPSSPSVTSDNLTVFSVSESGKKALNVEENSEFYLEDGFKIYKSLDLFEANLPSTVTLLSAPNGGKVFVVGTAHFSKESQDDVSLVIRNVRPEIVVVELCPSRVHILKNDEKTLLAESDFMNFKKIREIIRTNGVVNGLFYILLLNMSSHLTLKFGMAPGGEFRRALIEMKRLPNCRMHLGDRPINITLQRAMYGLSFWQTIILIKNLFTFDDSINKEDVEKCKEKDILEALMEEMIEEFPVFGRVFVEERDLYLTYSLQSAALQHNMMGAGGGDEIYRPVNVVGIVGIGHAAGIKEMWGKIDVSKIPSILVVPKPSLKYKIFKNTMKYGTLGLIAYGIFKFAKPRIQSFL